RSKRRMHQIAGLRSMVRPLEPQVTPWRTLSHSIPHYAAKYLGRITNLWRGPRFLGRLNEATRVSRCSGKCGHRIVETCQCPTVGKSIPDRISRHVSAGEHTERSCLRLRRLCWPAKRTWLCRGPKPHNRAPFLRWTKRTFWCLGRGTGETRTRCDCCARYCRCARC